MVRRVAVVGAGSVGRRHLRNLHSLGVEVVAIDPREDRLDEAEGEVPLVRRATELDAAGLEGIDGVVVASPPAFHVDQATLALDLDLPVLLEKPMSHDLEEARRLAAHANASRVLVGYSYRWWPAVQELRRVVLDGEVGRVLHVSCSMAAHLADWHPWERYQDFFMASRDLGGGALLDESHVIDLMLWFFGMPQEIAADVSRVSDLEIDTDDNVDLLWRTASGPRVVIHLDLYSRPHDRSILVRGTEGSARWTFDPNQVALELADGTTDVRSFTNDRNDMFMAEAAELLLVIDGAAPSCGTSEGVNALRIVAAARRASSSERWVEVDDA